MGILFHFPFSVLGIFLVSTSEAPVHVIIVSTRLDIRFYIKLSILHKLPASISFTIFLRLPLSFHSFPLFILLSQWIIHSFPSSCLICIPQNTSWWLPFPYISEELVVSRISMEDYFFLVSVTSLISWCVSHCCYIKFNDLLGFLISA